MSSCLKLFLTIIELVLIFKVVLETALFNVDLFLNGRMRMKDFKEITQTNV